jgi:hypothetical protein
VFTARLSFAPHDRLGYACGELDARVLSSAVLARVQRAVSALARDTWGAGFAAVNRPDARYFLRYRGDAKAPPAHLDIQATQAGAQTANAILYLSSCATAVTRLLGVNGEPDTLIAPERGKIVVWRSYTDAGCVDPRAMHSADPPTAGEKLLLTIALRRAVG